MAAVKARSPRAPYTRGRSPRARLRGLTAAGRLAERHVSQRGARGREPPRGSGWRGAQFDAMVVSAFAVAFLLHIVVGVGMAVVVASGIVIVTAFRVVRIVLSRRQAARRAQRLRAAVRLMIAELEAGHSPAVALDAVRELAPESWLALDGLDGLDGLGGAGGSDGSDGLVGRDHGSRVAAVAWHVAVRHGLPLADVLARVADDLDSRADQRSEVAAVLAGPRASSALLALLPLVGIGLGAAMGARPLGFLFGSAAGEVVLVVGVVLDALGALWTHRLTMRAELA